MNRLLNDILDAVGVGGRPTSIPIDRPTHYMYVCDCMVITTARPVQIDQRPGSGVTDGKCNACNGVMRGFIAPVGGTVLMAVPPNSVRAIGTKVTPIDITTGEPIT